MGTFQLGDLVTESREPYPMTGTIVTEITRVGLDTDTVTYGVRFTLTADTITEVDPDDIELTAGEVDRLADYTAAVERRRYAANERVPALSMSERIAEQIADIEALLADAEKMTDAQRLRAYGTLGVGLLTDKLAELKADAVSRSGHVADVYQVVSAVECQIVSSEHGVLQAVPEEDLLAACSTYEDALWKVVDHAKHDRGFLRPTADVDRWEMVSAPRSAHPRVRYSLSIRAVSPC